MGSVIGVLILFIFCESALTCGIAGTLAQRRYLRAFREFHGIDKEHLPLPLELGTH